MPPWVKGTKRFEGYDFGGIQDSAKEKLEKSGNRVEMFIGQVQMLNIIKGKAFPLSGLFPINKSLLFKSCLDQSFWEHGQQ